MSYSFRYRHFHFYICYWPTLSRGLLKTCLQKVTYLTSFEQFRDAGVICHYSVIFQKGEFKLPLISCVNSRSHLWKPEAYIGACQTSIVELFCEISWVFLLKRPITYVLQGSKYAPGKFLKGESLTSRNFHIHIFSYSWNYHKLNFKTQS